MGKVILTKRKKYYTQANYGEYRSLDTKESQKEQKKGRRS